MFKRTSRGAVIVASVSLALLAAVGSAKANLNWGSGFSATALVAVDTTAQAAIQSFNQPNPILLNENGSIPTTTNTTQFAVCLVNNANGSQRVVMMLRYLDGSVYTIISSDEKLAELAASNKDNVNLTGSFYFATVSGQKVLRQTVYVNGVASYITWGQSTSIVKAFTMPGGACRNLNWGGTSLLTESADSSM